MEKKCLQSFQTLSTRKRKAEETSENTVKVIVQGFDLLYLNGESLLRKPFIERRQAMYVRRGVGGGGGGGGRD